MGKTMDRGGAARKGALRILADHLELGKARLAALVVLTAAAGFVIGSPGPIEAGLLAWVAAGTALTACGAGALNQVMEVERDRRMERTRRRPLPSGRIGARHAALFGLLLAGGGPLLLASRAGSPPALLAAAAAAIYLFVYTPLKSHTPLCTLAGAIPGATAPLLGFAAASRSIDPGGWTLAAILFLWQVPHFLALAWIHRDDYGRAGFRMLPVVDRAGRFTFPLILVYASALLPVALVPAMAGEAGPVYAVGSFLLGLILLGPCIFLYRRKGRGDARHLFFATLLYLPLLFALMVVDRRPPGGEIARTAASRFLAGRPPGPSEHRIGSSRTIEEHDAGGLFESLEEMEGSE